MLATAIHTSFEGSPVRRRRLTRNTWGWPAPQAQPLASTGPDNRDESWTKRYLSIAPSKQEVLDYRVTVKLGAGSEGKVFLGQHKETGQKVAIKVLPKGDKKAEKRARREVSIMRKLQGHRHIPKVIEAVENDKRICIVMEYYEGGDLHQYLTSKHSGSSEEGALDPMDAWRIFKQLATTIAHVHGKGFVHRDLKPENIFFSDKGRQNVIVGDWGYACAWSSVRKKKAQCGSVHYMSSELLQRHSYTGPEVDLWALGATLYAMLTGKHPFVEPKDSGCETGNIMQGRWRSDPRISLACSDLLGIIFEPDPLKRATIFCVLNHPYVKCRPISPLLCLSSGLSQYQMNSHRSASDRVLGYSSRSVSTQGEKTTDRRKGSGYRKNSATDVAYLKVMSGTKYCSSCPELYLAQDETLQQPQPQPTRQQQSQPHRSQIPQAPRSPLPPLPQSSQPPQPTLLQPPQPPPRPTYLLQHNARTSIYPSVLAMSDTHSLTTSKNGLNGHTNNIQQHITRSSASVRVARPRRCRTASLPSIPAGETQPMPIATVAQAPFREVASEPSTPTSFSTSTADHIAISNIREHDELINEEGEETNAVPAATVTDDTTGNNDVKTTSTTATTTTTTNDTVPSIATLNSTSPIITTNQTLTIDDDPFAPKPKRKLPVSKLKPINGLLTTTKRKSKKKKKDSRRTQSSRASLSSPLVTISEDEEAHYST